MKDGLYTLILESHFKSLPGFRYEFGWGNGYVFIPPKHPFYGKNYDDLNIHVHGGLTYGSKFNASRFPIWIEDVEFEGDVTLDNYKKFDNYWVIGFDTAHSGDNQYSCSKDYVMSETESMLKQCLSSEIEGIQKYIHQYSIKVRKDKLKKIENL